VKGRGGRAHAPERLFGGDPPIHDPGALGLAVLTLDGVQEIRQRGLVAGIARHHLVGEGEPFGGDDQRNDHLHAIRALIPAIAKLPLPFVGWHTLEIGAGQVIQQHVEAGIEQAPPPLGEKTETGLLVIQESIQTPV
jgi:hypothetical protein